MIMMHNESNKRDVLISKTICWVLAFFLLLPHIDYINQSPIILRDYVNNVIKYGHPHWGWYIWNIIVLLFLKLNINLYYEKSI